MAAETVSIEERVASLVEPLLARDGYELVFVEYVPRGQILRLFIDRTEGRTDGRTDGHEGGVTLDDCTRVSRTVSDLLDVEGISDDINARYTLEVSSPGLDRPLVKPRDFARFVGHTVKLTTREPIAGRRKFKGALVRADEAGIALEVDGRAQELGYGAIEQARLVPEL